MSNLESKGANSSRDFGGIENGDSSDAAAQFSTPSARLEVLEESRDDLNSFDSMWFPSEDFLVGSVDFTPSHPSESTRNDLKRKGAISNHKGVHFRKKNKKFVARLCLPGGKNRKFELGEYNTHDEAARAYQVAAFYYNKSSTSNCEDHDVLDTLPCVPDNLSHAGKMAWVRERVRHSVASIGTSESPGICPLKRVLESGGSSFDARPGTPASYGTQGSRDNYDSTPTTPTTSGSADPDNSFWGYSGKEPYATMLEEMKIRFPVDAINNWIPAAPKRKSASKRQKTRLQGSPILELQQGRNSNALTNQAPVVDHQVVSEVKMTDSILFALVELRKQGWEWTLKLRSPSSVKGGVLFSVPKGQYAAPALRITDIITNSFHELREQGWEVHLQPHEGGKVELVSELCVAPTGCAAQDKMKASELFALSLRIGTWQCSSGSFGSEVLVKFSYARQKLVWKVRESAQSRKMEILWSDIDAMKAIYSNVRDTLEICVSRPPSFIEDTTLWSDWVACTDFTEEQASMFKVHVLRFSPGVLKEHYEKLVQCDPRLKAAHIRGQEYESLDKAARMPRPGNCISLTPLYHVSSPEESTGN